MTDTMTPLERIQAAIELRKPDRVPVAPDFDIYVARHAGLTMRELFFDFEKAEEALEVAYRDFRWDANHLFLGGTGPFMQLIFSQPFRMPGVDGVGEDEVPQMLETERSGPGLYEEICRGGFSRLYLENLERIMPRASSPAGKVRIAGALARFSIRTRRHLRKWESRGIPCLAGAFPGLIAFDVLSGIRSMGQFSLDLHRYPDLVLRALTIANRFCVELMIRSAKAARARFCFIGSARPSASFISPGQFERFALPLFADAVAGMVGEGLTPFLHFDSDWTPMLPYLLELPRAKCILDLDGSTDIFKAKEVLGGHTCLMGDVPAALLSLGTIEEVEEYCARLIVEAGAEGGFILSSGCSVPPEARPDNVRAFVESVRKFRPA